MFSQICQLLFTEQIVQAPAILSGIKVTKESFSKAKEEVKRDESEELSDSGSERDSDEEEDIPLI